MLLGHLNMFRHLSPAFSLQGVIICWQCSLCRKLFMTIPHDVPPGPDQVARIQSEFEQHDCAVHFAARHWSHTIGGVDDQH